MERRSRRRSRFKGFRHELAAFGSWILDSVAARARYAEPKMVALGALGFFGFPLYGALWTYVFPQPYESMTLRLICSALFLPLMLVHRWPVPLRPWLPLYWYVSVTLAVPFFFTVMLLANNFSVVWLMSDLVSLFLLMLIFDFAAFLVTWLIGTFAGVVVFLLIPHAPLAVHDLPSLICVWLFAFVAGGIFTVSRAIETQARIDALTAIAGNIAHELRTPLASIRMGAQAIAKNFDLLIEGFQLARVAGLPVGKIRSVHLASLEKSARIIEREVEHASIAIDMLLAAARPAELDVPELIAAAAVVQASVERYPYGSESERSRISVQIDEDFPLRAASLLLVHVMFNLMKNALHHTGRAGRGVVEIRVRRTAEHGVISVRDTGPGVAPEILGRVFERFVTSADRAEIGLGIGLAFCKEAMTRMRGRIWCRSELGRFTEFTLEFPIEAS